MADTWSWRHAILKSALPATTKHVLLVISCHMNDVGGGCYPSTKKLAAECSLSERSVCTHIEEAEKGGWLYVERHGFNGQKWARHEYSPRWPKGTESGAKNVEGTEPDDKKALNVLPKGTESGAPYIDNIPKNIPKRTFQQEAPAGFDVFWQAYPLKVGKPKALSSWKAQRLEVAAADVLDGLDRWKRSSQWKRDGGKFIPHPTTFLNQRRWEDRPEPERAPVPFAPDLNEPIPF